MQDNNGADNTSNSTGPQNHITFNNVEWDDESLLYGFGSRSYDSTTLNWLTADHYRGAIAQPMSLNRYAFVGDNPVRFADWGGFTPGETANSGNELACYPPNNVSSLIRWIASQFISRVSC